MIFCSSFSVCDAVLQRKLAPIQGDRKMVIGLDILKLEARYDFPVSLVLNYMDQGKEPVWKIGNGMDL